MANLTTSHLLSVLPDQVVFEYAKDRPIIFSSFQPDAAQVMRKLQSTYPVSTLVSDALQICKFHNSTFRTMNSY